MAPVTCWPMKVLNRFSMSPVPLVVTQQLLFPKLDPISSPVSGTTYEGSSSICLALERTAWTPSPASGVGGGMVIDSINVSFLQDRETISSRSRKYKALGALAALCAGRDFGVSLDLASRGGPDLAERIGARFPSGGRMKLARRTLFRAEGISTFWPYPFG